MALPDGFPDHAHRGFITMTYLLPSSPGALSHEDFLGRKHWATSMPFMAEDNPAKDASAGNAGILQPGDAQWMTCGRGILHSEARTATKSIL